MTDLTLTSLAYNMKTSDAKASKFHLKCSSRMIIFIKLVSLCSVHFNGNDNYLLIVIKVTRT